MITFGKTLLNGTSAPSNSIGTNGEFYIDTTSGTIYGPKTAGLWGEPTSIVGPRGLPGVDGSAGAQGLQGPQGIQGIQGLQGLTGLTGAAGAAGAAGAQGLQGPQGPIGPSGGIEITFGANLLGTNGTRYLYPGSGSGSTASNTVRIRRMARAWTATSARVANSLAGTGTGSYTITLVTVSESDVLTPTALTFNVNATDRAADTTSSVFLAEGQRIAMPVAASGEISASPTGTIVTLLLQPA